MPKIKTIMFGQFVVPKVKEMLRKDFSYKSFIRVNANPFSSFRIERKFVKYNGNIGTI